MAVILRIVTSPQCMNFKSMTQPYQEFEQEMVCFNFKIEKEFRNVNRFKFRNVLY